MDFLFPLLVELNCILLFLKMVKTKFYFLFSVFH